MRGVNPWRTLSSEQKYDNPWITVTEHQVLNPSGKPGIYGTVHVKHLALGIVPLDDSMNTWLVGQHRYALDAYSWEIPEGGGPPGSEPLESAKRELAEETGIQAERWDLVQEMHLSNSITDERSLIYVARGLSFGDPQPEETEALAVWKLPFEEALQMVLDGAITDACSVAGLMRVKLLLTLGKL